MKVEVPTDNVPFEERGRHYGRRSTDTTLGSLADSALLKLLQYGITALALPAITWAINNAATRLGDIEKTLQGNATVTATYELRIRGLEQTAAERSTLVRTLTERVLVLEQEMRSVQRNERRP